MKIVQIIPTPTGGFIGLTDDGEIVRGTFSRDTLETHLWTVKAEEPKPYCIPVPGPLKAEPSNPDDAKRKQIVELIDACQRYLKAPNSIACFQAFKRRFHEVLAAQDQATAPTPETPFACKKCGKAMVEPGFCYDCLVKIATAANTLFDHPSTSTGDFYRDLDNLRKALGRL